MDGDKSWVCCECGTVNGGEYEICYKCGAVRRAVNAPMSASAAKPTKKKHNGKPRSQKGDGKKKKGLAPVLIIAAVAVVVFVLASVCFHMSAQKYANEGRYGDAAAMARLDLLFSADLKESAWIEKGRELYESGDYSEALEYLEDFAETEEGKLLIDRANMMLAYKYFDEGDYDRAISLAESVTSEGLDLVGLLDDAYFAKGMAALKEKALSKAKSAFDKVTNDKLAADYAEVLGGLETGDYMNAATLAATLAGYDDDRLYLNQWYDIFDEQIEAADKSAIDKNMQMHAALRQLAGDSDFTSEESYVSYASPRDQVFSDDDHTLVTLDELSRCGSSEDGKVIVLWEIHKYGTDEIEYYIDWSAMEDLPKELYPQSLDEVGRSIRIVCSGQKVGWYGSGDESSDAVREYYNVYAGTGYNGGGIYSSSTVWGANCPSRAYPIPGVPVFGGLNTTDKNVNDYIYKAMRKMVL